MALDLITETATWLLRGEDRRGVSRVVRQIWLYAVVLIIGGALLMILLGSLGGLLDVPSDTRRSITWAAGLFSIATLAAGAFLLISFLIQKLGSILGRVTGNTNVHPD